MIKLLINILKRATEQNKAQTRLNILIGQRKKSDYIKITLPKKYIPMIEVLARYGVENSIQLLRILEKESKL